MQITEIIAREIIDLKINAGSKIEALEYLTGLLSKAERISDRSRFLDEILKREAVETTDLGFGVVIPHGRSAVVLKPSVAIGKFTTPFQWDEDPDQQAEPIFVCFLMASSPADTDVSHIEIIAKIATLLINDQFVESLKEEISAQQLLDKISSLIGEE